jgi:hypothetical protein
MYQIVKRKDAILHGKIRYYTGFMCRNGHDCERYASNGTCVECVSPSNRTVKHLSMTHRTVRLTLRVPIGATDDQVGRLSQWIDAECAPSFFRAEYDAEYARAQAFIKASK